VGTQGFSRIKPSHSKGYQVLGLSFKFRMLPGTRWTWLGHQYRHTALHRPRLKDWLTVKRTMSPFLVLKYELESPGVHKPSNGIRCY